MDKITEKINKLSLPVVVLIASIILGGFIYASQVSKRQSIEKQQQIELQTKTEQDKKEYVAKQKNFCLNIYQAESKKWNNTDSWNYNDTTDKCEIIYKEKDKKPEAECDKIFADISKRYEKNLIPPDMISLYLNCLDGTFTKEF